MILARAWSLWPAPLSRPARRAPRPQQRGPTRPSPLRWLCGRRESKIPASPKKAAPARRFVGSISSITSNGVSEFAPCHRCSAPERHEISPFGASKLRCAAVFRLRGGLEFNAFVASKTRCAVVFRFRKRLQIGPFGTPKSRYAAVFWLWKRLRISPFGPPKSRRAVVVRLR